MVLWIEISPAFLAKWQESSWPKLRRFSRWVLPKLERILMIVFGIADADGVVNRQAERLERIPQPGGLRHALRQYHQPAAIERQDERLLQPPDHIEHRLGTGRVSFDDDFAREVLDVAPVEFRDERGCGRVTDGEMATAGRELQYRAVLTDDGVEAAHVAGNAAQVVEPPAGDQDDRDPLLACRADGAAH